MYGEGQGVSQDDAEAVQWFRRAAEQGVAAAQASLGIMYALGRGVPQDHAEAVKWYRRAAEQGNALAQAGLGYMYMVGQGVQQDYAEAEPLYQRALAIWEKALGPEHPLVATILENYADLLRKTGRTTEAAKMVARAWAIRAKRAKGRGTLPKPISAPRAKTPTLRDKPDRDLCLSLPYGNPDFAKEAERRELTEKKCKEILGQ